MSILHRVKGPNYISILAFSILLFLLGLVIMMTLRGSSFGDDVLSQSRVVVELSPEVTKARALELTGWLSTQPSVDKETVRSVSKSEAYQEMYGAEINEGEHNPFYDIILYGYDGGISDDMKDKVEEELRSLNGVSQIIKDDGAASDMQLTLSWIRAMVLGGGVLVMLLLTVILYHFVKMKLASQREELRIQELVGATDDFIRKPYLVEGAKAAVVSGVIALMGLLIMGLVLDFTVGGEVRLFSWLTILISGVIAMIIGLAVSLCTTYILVNLYLKSLYKS